MNRMMALMFGISILLVSQKVSAQDEPETPTKATTEDKVARIAKLGPGVHNLVKDKEGHVVSCVVVGQARISTALGKSKGLEQARNKANLDCSAQFVKWLKEKVTVFESNEDETVTLLEGSEEDEESTLKESGKSVEKATKKMESIAEGLVRGLVMIGRQQEADGKTYTVVKGWSLKNSEASKNVAAHLASDEPASKSNAKGGTEGAKKKPSKEIEDETVVSEAADEFLP